MLQSGGTSSSSSIVVVGGGIIGLLIARELHLAGCRVSVIERGQVARESSWAGGGILSPLYPWRYHNAVTELARHSQQIYPVLAEQLLRDTGIDPEWTPSGLLIVQSKDALSQSWLQKYDVDAQWMNSSQLAAFEPALSRSDEGVFLPSIAQVRNPKFAEALERDLMRREISIQRDVSVTGITTQGDSVTGVETAQGRIPATQVVVAAGAWTRQLLEPFGFNTPIKPMRGQMLMYQTPPNFLRHIILKNDRYLIPRRDGLVLVGSTVEDVGFDKSTTSDARESLVEFVQQTLPNLARYPVVKHWAGLRPSAPDGIPIISRHPSISGLYCAAGHYRNGVVMAPATARLLTDIFLGKTSFCDPFPYRW